MLPPTILALAKDVPRGDTGTGEVKRPLGLCHSGVFLLIFGGQKRSPSSCLSHFDCNTTWHASFMHLDLWVPGHRNRDLVAPLAWPHVVDRKKKVRKGKEGESGGREERREGGKRKEGEKKEEGRRKKKEAALGFWKIPVVFLKMRNLLEDQALLTNSRHNFPILNGFESPN